MLNERLMVKEGEEDRQQGMVNMKYEDLINNQKGTVQTTNGDPWQPTFQNEMAPR